MLRYASIMVVLLCCLATGVSATVIHVDINGGGDFSAIKPAVAVADSGDTIVVAPGTYTGSDNTEIDFVGTHIVLVSEDVQSPALTVIDCENTDRAFSFMNGEDYHCVVEGFTITRGRADQGGAVFCGGCGPIFHNCIFDDNHADSFGGAIYIGTNSEIQLIECEFLGNHADTDGGAIYATGALPIIRSNVFEGNNAAQEGGAIAVKFGTWATIAGCEFLGNSSGVGGGAIYAGMTGPLAPGGGSPDRDRISGTVVKNSSFYENTSGRGGGLYINAFSEVSVSFNTFIRNTAALAGGGLFADTSYEGKPTILNCTFCFNGAPQGSGIYSKGGVDYNHMIVQQSVMIYGVEGRGLHREPSSYLETNWCLTYANDGGDDLLGGSNLISVDPLLCDIYADDFFACADSPCLHENNEFDMHLGSTYIGCGNCSTAVEAISWGMIKAMYR